MKLGSTHFTEEQQDNLRSACTGKRFAIVAARFHQDIAEKLVDGARRALVAHGVAEDAIDVYDVPGAFELPLAARTLILRREHRDVRSAGRLRSRFVKSTPPRIYAGIIALGAVIRGETPHFDFVAGECARGIMNVQLETGAPIGFGVLTTETLEQAEQRASAEGGDKGYDAVLAVASLLALRYSEAIKHAKSHSLNGHAHVELTEPNEELEPQDEQDVEQPVEVSEAIVIVEASSEESLDEADELVDDFQGVGTSEEPGDPRLLSDEPGNLEVHAVEDKTLICKDCSKEFVFTADEQQFFIDKGFQNDPQRCRECRQTRRNANRAGTQRPNIEIVCDDCGVTTTVPFQPREGRPVYCRACYAKHASESTTA